MSVHAVYRGAIWQLKAHLASTGYNIVRPLWVVRLLVTGTFLYAACGWLLDTKGNTKLA
jgi:hypothetical protein